MLNDFRRIVDLMKARPFVMLGVNMDSSLAVTIRGNQRNKIPWSNMTWRISTERNITDDLSITRGLNVYLLDDKGIIRYRKRWNMGDNVKELADAIYEQVRKVETNH
jgi:hypothetical protein